MVGGDPITNGIVRRIKPCARLVLNLLDGLFCVAIAIMIASGTLDLYNFSPTMPP